MQDPVHVVHRQIWRETGLQEGDRPIPEETAISLTYNGGSYAVMMATPRDLEDFAIGFSHNEGIIDDPAAIDSLEVIPLDDGIELRMWLAQAEAGRLQDRRRHIAGPTGCGLCGIDSISEAMRPAATVPPGRRFRPGQIMAAAALLRDTLAPTDAQIDAAMAGHLCRCGTQHRVRAAIRSLAAAGAGASS